MENTAERCRGRRKECGGRCGGFGVEGRVSCRWSSRWTKTRRGAFWILGRCHFPPVLRTPYRTLRVCTGLVVAKTDAVSHRRIASTPRSSHANATNIGSFFRCKKLVNSSCYLTRHSKDKNSAGRHRQSYRSARLASFFQSPIWPPKQPSSPSTTRPACSTSPKAWSRTMFGCLLVEERPERFENPSSP